MGNDEDLYKIFKQQMKFTGAAFFLLFLMYIVWYFFGKH